MCLKNVLWKHANMWEMFMHRFNNTEVTVLQSALGLQNTYKGLFNNTFRSIRAFTQLSSSIKMTLLTVTYLREIVADNKCPHITRLMIENTRSPNHWSVKHPSAGIGHHKIRQQWMVCTRLSAISFFFLLDFLFSLFSVTIIYFLSCL